MSTSDYEEEKPRGKRKANAKQTSHKNRMDGLGGKQCDIFKFSYLLVDYNAINMYILYIYYKLMFQSLLVFENEL